MMRPRFAARTVLALAFLVALTATIALMACGSSDDATATPATPEPAAQATPAPTATPQPTPPPPAPTAAPQPTAAPTPPPAPAPMVDGTRMMGEVEGIIFMVGEGSEATFTVTEQLASLSVPNDAVVRTRALSGFVYLDGRDSIVEIDLHQLSSDSEFRDRYIRERMFSQDSRGLVTVQGMDSLPAGFTEGETVTATIEASLIIQGEGIGLPMDWDVEARDDGDAVHILARTTFTWEQLGIPTPTARSVVSVDDEVRVEVLLAAVPVRDTDLAVATQAPQPNLPLPPLSSIVPIFTPTDLDPELYLSQFPEDEAACLSDAFTDEQVSAMLADSAAALQHTATIDGCLSDQTLVLLFLGGVVSQDLPLSQETAICLGELFRDEEQMATVADYVLASMGTDQGAETATDPAAMVALPFIFCLNAGERAATPGMEGLASLECVFNKIPLEDRQALFTMGETGALPPVSVIAAFAACQDLLPP